MIFFVLSQMFAKIPFFIFLLLLTSTGSAEIFTPVENVHYQTIKTAPLIELNNSSIKNSDNVTLFLWYGCETCLRLEQLLKQSHPQNETNWNRLPANLLKQWRASTKTFLVLRTLNEPLDVDLQLMIAIHDLGSNLSSLESIEAFLANLGVNIDEFKAAYRSKNINDQIKELEVLQQQTPILKVPSALILSNNNQRYYVDLTMVESLEQFVATINYLDSDSSSTSPPGSNPATSIP